MSYQEQAQSEMWDAIAANEQPTTSEKIRAARLEQEARDSNAGANWTTLERLEHTRLVHRLSRAENACTVGALEKRGATLKTQLAEVVEELERIVTTARAVLGVKTSESTRELAATQLEQARSALERLRA